MRWWKLHCWRCQLDRLVFQPNDPTRWDSNGLTGRDPCPNCASLWVTADLAPELLPEPNGAGSAGAAMTTTRRAT